MDRIKNLSNPFRINDRGKVIPLPLKKRTKPTDDTLTPLDRMRWFRVTRTGVMWRATLFIKGMEAPEFHEARTLHMLMESVAASIGFDPFKS